MKEQDYLSIEAYLQGELTPAEAVALEARTAVEPALGAALAERRLLNNHLRADAVEPALKEVLSQLTAKYFGEKLAPIVPTSTSVTPLTTEIETASGSNVASREPRIKNRDMPPTSSLSRGGGSGDRGRRHQAKVKQLRPRKNTIRWLAGLAAAAAVALLLTFGGRVLFNDQGSVYEQFAQHQSLSLTERGDGDNGITTAEAAFNDGRYEDAIVSLQQYVQLNQDDARARLALGISHLETGDNAKAVRIFKEIAKNGGSLAPYGNWYLALAAVYRGESSTALRYLDLILVGDPFLKERIVELREVLVD